MVIYIHIYSLFKILSLQIQLPMSVKMDSSLETYGKLVFYRKNEEGKGTPYPLCSGETTIGSSSDSDIRLKLNDARLAKIHCIIDVEESGEVSKDGDKL